MSERIPASDEIIRLVETDFSDDIPVAVFQKFLIPEAILDDLIPVFSQHNMRNLCQWHPLSDDFKERHINDLYWAYISRSPYLEYSTIVRFQDMLDWSLVLETYWYQRFTEDQLRELQGCITKNKMWPKVAYTQLLSIEFIEEFKRKFTSAAAKQHISRHQPLTFEYVTKNILKLDMNEVAQNKNLLVDEEERETIVAMNNLIKYAE